MSFPSTSILDTFTDSSHPRNLSIYDPVNWAKITALFGSEMQTTGTSITQTASSGGNIWNTTFGPDCEVFMDISTAHAGKLRLLLRITSPTVSASFNCYYLVVNAAGLWSVFPVVNNVTGSTSLIPTTTQVVSVGDGIGFRAKGTTLSVWYRSGGTWTMLASGTDSSVTSAGFIGVASQDTVYAFDNFGGGTLSIVNTTGNFFRLF